MDMFAPEGHCLFQPERLRSEFNGWEVVSFIPNAFTAPENKRKVFATAIARKPNHAAA
ncbi:hypothetical protein BurJ1DRAFT_1895 [Burkholderiales bacterium JOSHI_001]|nr:hypothetical protein BurJ1DRAFT_1895 [Burkholderiales bacterium JOSHI_001]